MDQIRYSPPPQIPDSPENIARSIMLGRSARGGGSSKTGSASGRLQVDQPYRHLSLALSPPAAAQLARGLRKAVKKYLRHNVDTSQS